MNQVNQQTFIFVQIETAEAMQNLPQIIGVKGVDCALVGPNDLSIALGVPGDMKSPTLQNAIARVQQVCQEKGVYCGLHMNDPSVLMEWAKKGINVLSCGSEISMVMNTAKDISTKLGEAARLSKQ